MALVTQTSVIEQQILIHLRTIATAGARDARPSHPPTPTVLDVCGCR